MENDGGSAFPSNRDVSNAQKWEEIEGMSLRDYFAGQALTGQIAASFHLCRSDHAKAAYEIADAMLKAREV